LCSAQIPKPKSGTYVNDYTNNLGADDIQALNDQLLFLEKESTVQMAILLINDLPGNMSIEDYAREVGNSWKVGNNFNGIVYVAVLKKRRQRLEIAKNLEGDIPDITAAEMIENIKPYLQQQEYYNALSSLIAQISSHLGVDENISSNEPDPFVYTPSPPSEKTAFEKEKAKFDRYGDYAVVGIILSLIGVCIWAWKYKKKYVEMYTVNGAYTGIGSIYYPVDSSDGGSSSGGGFGGGGGGGFSGGGASGGW
jgi:uncharacterized membrane protein YgcG